jgi:hypothetical protein
MSLVPLNIDDGMSVVGVGSLINKVRRNDERQK